MTKDIEREAFEKALAGNNIHNLKVCTIFDDEKNEYFASDVCDPSEDHIVESINLSWRMWQAAKAQAVSEGFVVVPKTIPENVVERLKNSSYHWGENTKDYFSPIYKMMVEEAARGGNE